MSVTSRSPLRMAGAVINSGSVNTGEILHVRGGGQTACVFSGVVSGGVFSAGAGSGLVTNPLLAGAEYLLFTGAGRLNSVIPHTQMLSGAPIVFYDSAVATSGGPWAASGHKIVGVLPATYTPGMVSGGGLVAWTGAPINLDFAFQSGLIAHTVSGCPGFSIGFSPEVNLPNPG